MTATSSHFLGLPHTRLGWWSAGLALLFVVLLILFAAVFIPLSNNPHTTQSISIPNLGCPTVLCGLVAGVIGLLAMTRRQERSWLVWLSLLCGVLSIALLLGDFLAAIIN